MAEKIKGTVKWFSNRKGFGFITPSSDNSPTEEDIFVHQSNIVTEAEYRTLKDGFEVEFEAITDDNGKLKAQNVTSSDGSPCPGPEPREKRRRRPKKEGAAGESGDETGGETGGEKSDDAGEGKEEKKGKSRNRRRNRNGKKEGGEGKAQPKSWYTDLEESVQKSLESRSIKVDGGRAFLAVGDARIKLGTGGYLAMAHTTGMLAEGTYACDKDGKVTSTWTHVLKYDGAEWKPSSADAEKDALVAEIDLTDESVKPTGDDESAETLWGEGKSDPKDALEKSGMQMRKIVLHPTPGGGRRRGRGRGRRGPKKEGEGEKQTEEKPAE